MERYRQVGIGVDGGTCGKRVRRDGRWEVEDGILVVDTDDLRIARRSATGRALLEAQLQSHLLPRVLGTQLGAVHGKMRLTSRWGGRRCHRFLSRGT